MPNEIDRVNVKGTVWMIKDTQARGDLSAIPVLQSDVTALQTNVNNRVLKAGDTMTGNLTLTDGAGVFIKSDNGLGELKIRNGYHTLSSPSSGTLLLQVATSSYARGLRLNYQSDDLLFEIQNIDGSTDTKICKIDYVYYTTFEGTTLEAESHCEYSNSTAISSLALTWPANSRGVIFGVNFTSDSSTAFSLTHFNQNGSNITNNVKTIGSSTTQKGKRYNLVCWYDGSYRWCAVKAA